MHNAAFRALRFDAVYIPLPAKSADDFIAFGKAVGISGASVTIPHKVSLFERLDEVYAGARRIGAINTIRVEGGRWVGNNTDAGGFLEPLQERLSLEGLRALRSRRRRLPRAPSLTPWRRATARCAFTPAIGLGQKPSRC